MSQARIGKPSTSGGSSLLLRQLYRLLSLRGKFATYMTCWEVTSFTVLLTCAGGVSPRFGAIVAFNVVVVEEEVKKK